MSATPSTILVVEDDAIVRMLIVDVLQELEFSVLEADGSERALELLEDTARNIDLLMTDVGLPGMDGRALATRARELRQTLPVLFARVRPSMPGRPTSVISRSMLRAVSSSSSRARSLPSASSTLNSSSCRTSTISIRTMASSSTTRMVEGVADIIMISIKIYARFSQTARIAFTCICMCLKAYKKVRK